MWNAGRNEHRRARGSNKLTICETESKRAFDDIPGLVVAIVHMERCDLGGCSLRGR
jgi:hypothetical protein